MTLAEFVQREPLGRLIYPEGVPAILRPPSIDPEWNEIDDELPGCQREHFLPLAANAPAIPLEAVVQHYVCLSFCDLDEARDWTPLWMCASIHAYRTNVSYAGEVVFKTSLKLALQIESGKCPVTREAVVDFYRQTAENCDSSLEEAMIKAFGFDPEKDTAGWWDDDE